LLKGGKEEAVQLRYRVVKTASGYAGFVASERGVRRVYLPFSRRESLERAIGKDVVGAVEDPHLMADFAGALRRYLSGKPVKFDVRCDWKGRTSFEVDVWQACRRIGYGQTRSYKDLAEEVGRPGGARAIGMAMRRNPCPLVVPCHRVVRSDGSPGGFSSRGGTRLKQRLLQMEGAAPVI
jgi:methylated-DNA-[protein]-cysteine S-methyltransferase